MLVLLTTGMGRWPIIRELAWLMGKIMDGIYYVMSHLFDVENIGACIIIFTIITFTLLIPLTIKQQKSSKLMAIVQPEITKVQKKYQGKTDQASQLKMQEEMQAVYDKYGTSMTAGCLPSLIQMPFLFALYPVIQNIPVYVSGVRELYKPIVEAITATGGYQKIMEEIGSVSPILMSAKEFDYTDSTVLTNVLYHFQDATWNTLLKEMPSIGSVVETTRTSITNINDFFGVNIAETPWNMLQASLHPMAITGIIAAVLIPVLAGLSQFVSTKLITATTQQQQTNNGGNDAMGNYMKSMTYTMPLVSVFIGFTMPAGLGIYWIASAVVRCIQQIAINKYLSTKSIESIIEENKQKAEKKAKKKKNSVSAETINRMATANTRNIEKTFVMSEKEKEEKIAKAAEYRKNAKRGSMADMINMVDRYNNGQVEPPVPVEEEPTDKKGKKKKK